MMAGVVVVGNNTMDLVVVTDEAVRAGAKVQAASWTWYAGGQAANAAVTMAGLGLAVEYVGAFGDDPDGMASRASLEEAGVGVSRGVTIPGCSQHVAVVVVHAKTGDRSILMYKDRRLALDHMEVGRLAIPGAAALYLDGHESAVSLLAAQTAQRVGVRVVCDAEVADDGLRRLIPYVDDLVAPAEVLCELTGSRSIPASVATGLEMGPLRVVATSGSDGVTGQQRGRDVVRLDASTCRVVDTTGAGDAFHGAYLAASLHGLSFSEILGFAATVAAAACEVPGPRLPADRLAGFRAALAARGFVATTRTRDVDGPC
jgi:sulfofructose kinase